MVRAWSNNFRSTSSSFSLAPLQRLLKRAQHFGVRFKKFREAGQRFERGRAEVMLDAFDVVTLRFGVEIEQREEA